MESYTLPNLLDLLWSFSLESCLLMSTVANLSLRESISFALHSP